MRHPSSNGMRSHTIVTFAWFGIFGTVRNGTGDHMAKKQDGSGRGKGQKDGGRRNQNTKTGKRGKGEGVGKGKNR